MRLTRQTEIAIGILVACARTSSQPVQIRHAAAAAATTYAHAVKIVRLLADVGFITTVRGRRGGLMLALPPEEITLGAILRRTQPELVEMAAPAGRRRTAISTSLETIFTSAQSTFTRLMDRFTIVDLAAKPAVSRLACLDCRLINPVSRQRPDAGCAPCGERSASYAP